MCRWYKICWWWQWSIDMCKKDDKCKVYNYVQKEVNLARKVSVVYKNVNSPLIDSNGIDFHKKVWMMNDEWWMMKLEIWIKRNV